MKKIRTQSSSLKRTLTICLGFIFCLVVVFSNNTAIGDDKKHSSKKSLDKKLKKSLKRNHVAPIDLGPTASLEMIELGQALFFDPILSGNRDTACSTCHYPSVGTSDQLALGVGTGTMSPGKVSFFREKGPDRIHIPRNAPELFNKGSVLWTSQFWDSRVASAYGSMSSPAGSDLPSGLTTPLAVQAMFPVTSGDEMRGSITDFFDPVKNNEIADPALDGDLPGIWNALMQRLTNIDGYANPTDGLFVKAFGEVPSNLGFESAATAMAAFETSAFGYDDSPFDEYLKGDRDAMTTAQKRGAILFYGKLKCSTCHSGTLMTDQNHYNIGAPQFGPGKDETGLDLGRYLVTGDESDRFKFRVPGLRNVTQTAPYLHNGAFYSLSDVIMHHLDVKKSLRNYDPVAELVQGPELSDTYVDDPDVLNELIYSSDVRKKKIKSSEMADLLEFMNALTAPNIGARLESTIPSSVPSGLPVDEFDE